ncbi:MAG: PAS domain S-box protein [Flavobacterium sp.]|nr:MAG: PAS domain S-box protein [Flavobacterium sp.]
MNESRKGNDEGRGIDVDYQQQLYLYQQRIANILESFTDCFFEVTKDWTVTYWNKQAEILLGMPREDILGKNLWDLYQDAIPLKFYNEYHRAIAQNISIRFEEYYPAKKLWFEVACFPSGEGLSVYFKDITERKKSTRLLELEKEKYSNLFNFSPLPQWVYDVETLRFLDVNEAAIKSYGYAREEFMSMSILQIRPAEDIPIVTQILKSKSFEENTRRSSVRHLKKDGEVIDVFVQGNSVSFDDKKARLVMAIDRTVELQSRKAMEESIARFDIVSKATSDAVWDLDVKTGEMIWNHGIEQIFGYHKSNYDFDWWRSKVHPNDLADLSAKFDKRVDRHEERVSVEYRFMHADGKYRCVLDRSFVLFNSEGQPTRVIGSMQDITDRVNQLSAIEGQNEKLKEISWFQAHSVRGPLSSIIGLANLLEIDENINKDIAEIVSKLKASANDLDSVLREIIKRT